MFGKNRKLPPDDLPFKNLPSNFPFKLTNLRCNNPNSSKLNWILLGPISVKENFALVNFVEPVRL